MKHVKSVLILSICIAICCAKQWTPEQKEAIREKLKNAAEELKQKIESAQVKWNDYLAKHKTASDFEKKSPDPRLLSDNLEKFINGVKELDAARDQKKAEEKQAKMELIEQVAPFIKQEYDRIAAKIKEKQDAKLAEAMEAWNEMQQLATDVANIIKTEHEKKKAEKREAWDKFKENVFGITPKPAVANAVQPAVRNAFLDEVTGTAPYKTWTWILLVICVIIGVLLVIAIIYHVTRPVSHYQRLYGSDHAHHSHGPDEFTPFAPTKSLVEAPVKKLSASKQLPHTDIPQSRSEVPFPLRTEIKTASAQPQKDNTSSLISVTPPKFSPPKTKPNFTGHEAIPEDEEPAQSIEENHEDQHLAQHDEQHKKADDPSANQDPAAAIPAPSDAIVSGGYDPVQIQNPPKTNTKQHDDQAEIHPQVEDPVKPGNEAQQNDDKKTEEPHEIHYQQQTEEDEQKPKEESDT